MWTIFQFFLTVKRQLKNIEILKVSWAPIFQSLKHTTLKLINQNWIKQIKIFTLRGRTWGIRTLLTFWFTFIYKLGTTFHFLESEANFLKTLQNYTWHEICVYFISSILFPVTFGVFVLGFSTPKTKKT